VNQAVFYLAQANIARMRSALDSTLMEGFVSRLEAVNAAAENSPGFVWRLQTEQGDATAIRVFDDERILFNLSVWQDLESLRRYVYQGTHLEPLKLRDQWFEKMKRPHQVLWWVPAGHRPDTGEARERLDRLAEKGPTADAFDFGHPFPSTSSATPVRAGV
jgi:hypothetical protein